MNRSKEFNPYHWVLPVATGKIVAPEIFETAQINGSAFSIGSDFFVSCMHVVEAAQSHGTMMFLLPRP